MNNDPYQDLRAELISAAARLDAAPVARPRRSWWRRRQPLGIVIAALVICGSAAAAVVSLNATSSQPLAGKVPGRPATNLRAGSIAGYRYRIEVTPALTAGVPGWTSSIMYTNPTTGLFGGGASGGGGYPTRADPVLQGAELELINTRNGHQAETVGWVLTGPAVAAVRVGSQMIQTFSSPQLPAGDRAAVYFLRPSAGQPPAALRAGVHRVGRHGRAGVTAVIFAGAGQTARDKPIPLDRNGAPIGTALMPPSTPVAPGTFWQAKTAISPNVPTSLPFHGPTRPRPGVCEMTQHGLPGLTPEWGRTITTISPATNAVGELFLPCVDTEYYLNGTPLNAGVLLDARHPGRTLGSLPGTQPVSGDRNVVNVNAAHLSAKRIGNAWLVVKGGYTLTQRLRVLQALQISKIDLQHTTRTDTHSSQRAFRD